MNIMDSNVQMTNFTLGTDVSITTQYDSTHSTTSGTSLRRKKGKSIQGNKDNENFSNNVSQIRNNIDVGMNTSYGLNTQDNTGRVLSYVNNSLSDQNRSPLIDISNDDSSGFTISLHFVVFVYNYVFAE
ncbi:hypothetical protein ACFE04_017480 [Oxalis oulophora]